ncbi:MAG: Hsp20/alpha crystallin family protein [Candidatus Bathyarchaeota archaeon]|nr:Hsp20/alpha crystallin family protein [Candidatus Bathyarchaeota archaeon]MDH5595820.1 Hsp20/alpha crystallin family protein [Candidatus Bathyarchaeota archaeon]
MSEPWWRRRRKKNSHPWFNMFDEFGRLEDMMDEMMSKAFEAPTEKAKAYRPYIYGFSMSIGPDGKPVIREFGNVQKSRFGPQIREEREPLVDVMEEVKDVVIVAELPGVEKSDIHLHTTEDHLTVSVDTPKRKYHKELTLPASVDPKSAQASYKNGVLEVRLKKLVEKSFKGEKIFVG